MTMNIKLPIRQKTLLDKVASDSKNKLHTRLNNSWSTGAKLVKLGLVEYPSHDPLGNSYGCGQQRTLVCLTKKGSELLGL